MRTTTMGLVLRATKTGEADRALLLLTPDGLVSAMAKGALRLKSRLFSGTGLFCYSEFTLFEGKTMFVGGRGGGTPGVLGHPRKRGAYGARHVFRRACVHALAHGAGG